MKIFRWDLGGSVLGFVWACQYKVYQGEERKVGHVLVMIDDPAGHLLAAAAVAAGLWQVIYNARC